MEQEEQQPLKQELEQVEDPGQLQEHGQVEEMDSSQTAQALDAAFGNADMVIAMPMEISEDQPITEIVVKMEEEGEPVSEEIVLASTSALATAATGEQQSIAERAPISGQIASPFFASLQSSSPGDLDSNKRRSSSRSIKRRRFDDELVEYSLGIPPPIVPKIERKDRKPTPISTVTAAVAGSSGSPLPVAASSSPTVHRQPEIPPTPTPSLPAVPSPVSAGGDSKRRPSARSSGSVGASKRSRKKTQLGQMSTKDLGRWKPTDDLALIIGIQQTNDIRTVHRGVKFSCRFTMSEIQSRWYALLYNAEISRVAVAAMRNLHPDVIASVKNKALFSNGEEELLCSLSSTSKPNLEKFQELLEQNPSIFYPTRTPKSLMAHWQLLKQYSLLPDQAVQPLPKGDSAMSFSEAEELMNDSELQEPKDEALESELSIADRWNKKEIRLLENSVGRWQVLVESVTGLGSQEFDKQTLAVLRGRLVRYLMRSREITIGRSTKDHTVDVDLSLEGPSNKISRRQATIRLRNSGDFFMSSEGKRAIYVDGRPVLRGNKVKLNHNSVIEISSLKFIFLVNQEIINVVRHETVRNNSTLLMNS